MLYDLMKPNKKILTPLMLLTFLINKLSFFLIIAWWKVQHKHYALLQDKTKLFVLKKDFYHNSHVWSTDICSKVTWTPKQTFFTMTLFNSWIQYLYQIFEITRPLYLFCKCKQVSGFYDFIQTIDIFKHNSNNALYV